MKNHSITKQIKARAKPSSPPPDIPLQYDWATHARPNQLPPPGDWNTWLVMAGRGFGKTRTGAETLRQWVAEGTSRRIAVVGETEAETRQVMVEGPSGLLAVHPPEAKLQYEPSKRQLTWPNGAMALCYSGDKPSQLRGPQFDTAWVDEMAKFRHPHRFWEQLMFCLRLGDQPRTVITTTPRPDPFLKDLLAEEGVVMTRGTTFDNKANLSPGFLKVMKNKYLSTRLGQQELMAEMLEAEQGALWTPEMLEAAREPMGHYTISRLVVAIDPAVTSNQGSDETGLIVAGRTPVGQGIVLEDLSLKAKPTLWVQTAVEAYHRLKADRVVAEVNMGGDMVEQMLRSIDRQVSFKAVRATRGKHVRAEPIAALYEQGKISHALDFPTLEQQLLTYVPNQTRGSPDRMDALVWALTDLMLDEPILPPIRIWGTGEALPRF